VAVIFTSTRRAGDDEAYGEMAARMEELAGQRPGYLGIESVRDPATGEGITASYWATEADAAAWGADADHLGAQRLGRDRWYGAYALRIAVVSRTVRFNAAG
jgi:heme-degrading monooxygenase HmoA